MRKSRREKEQEAAEAKKREEEASAAQAYAEFVDAFEGEDVIKRKAGSAFVRADSSVAYTPSVSVQGRHIKPRVSSIAPRPLFFSDLSSLRHLLHLRLANQRGNAQWMLSLKKSKSLLLPTNVLHSLLRLV